ncbi:helicase SKI2W [Ixodes scapularis]
MEHLPQHLRFQELWGGKDVDVEPSSGIDLLDSPFPFGIPPVVPDAETQILEILEEIADNLSVHSVESTQRHFSAPPDVKSLLSCDVSATPSELRVRRNLATGTLEGYNEV